MDYKEWNEKAKYNLFRFYYASFCAFDWL